MILAVLLVAAIVLAVVFVASLRSPVRMLLAPYAFLVPFGSGIVLPIGLPSPFNTLTTLVGAAATVGLVVHGVMNRGGPPRLVRAVPAWLLFLAVCTLTYFWSIKPEATIDNLLVLAPLIGLFVLVALLPIDRSDVAVLERAVIAGGVVAGAYALYLLVGPGLPATEHGVPRFALAGGVEGDPNITAASLLLPLALSLGRGLHSDRGNERVVCLLAAGLIAAGIALTGSRGGIVAGIVVLAALAFHERRRVVTVSFAVLALAGGVVAFSLAPEGLQQRLQRTDSTHRTAIWRVGLEACPTYCVHGSGWGTFPSVYNLALGQARDAEGYRLGFKAHNIWLRAPLEGGVLALVFMIAALAATLLDVLRLPSSLRGPPLAALIGLLVSNTFLSNVDFKYFWLVLIHATMCTLAFEQQEEARAALPARSEPAFG